MRDPGTIRVQASARRTSAEKIEVQLALDIPERVHIEPHEPPEPWLIPTVVDFGDIEVTHVSYPEPEEKDVGLPGGPMPVYHGRVTVTAEGRIDEHLQTVHGTIRYQPCVGGACLPPRTDSWKTSIESAVPESRS